MIAQSDKNKSDNHSDFSIDHILNRAGCSNTNNSINDRVNFTTNPPLSLDPYSWLQCTRYCPPKVPRTHKRDGPQKRQLGRHPRIPFTSHQLAILEEKFQQSPYLSSEEVITLSKQLELADIRVKIWFQNRRARERREKLVQVFSENDNREKQSATGSGLLSQPINESNLRDTFVSHTFLQSHQLESNYSVSVSNDHTISEIQHHTSTYNNTSIR